MRRAIAIALLLLASCSGTARGPSNELLIIGYDREPDTLNRFASHILEDIESCVVEGLITTDEKMNVVPLQNIAIRLAQSTAATCPMRDGVRLYACQFCT